jgi:hypothetical protein
MHYRLLSDTNVFDSPDCSRLATEAAAGRRFRLCGTDADLYGNDYLEEALKRSGACVCVSCARVVCVVAHVAWYCALKAVPVEMGTSGGDRAAAVVRVQLCEDLYEGWLMMDASNVRPCSPPPEVGNLSPQPSVPLATYAW